MRSSPTVGMIVSMVSQAYKSHLKNRDIKIIEEFVAWPCGFGYVLDYSDRTFAEMFEDEFNLDIEEDKYRINGHSKRKRLLTFCQQEPLHIVLQVLKFLAQRHRNLVDDSDYPPPNNDGEKFQKLILSLEGEDTSIDTDVFVSHTATDPTLTVLNNELRELLIENKPDVALDRLHTYCMGKLEHLLRHSSISCSADEPLHSRFAKYRTNLEERHNLLAISKTALKTGISVFEEFNKVRNHHSLAHFNQLPTQQEARYIVDIIIAMLRLMKSVEGSRWD